MDPLLLARAQFGANITFRILFPTITIAPGWLLLFFRWRWLRTRDAASLATYRFWTKVFALSFALGVVSGITMSFQFGTNWPGFIETVGNVAGPLLAILILTHDLDGEIKGLDEFPNDHPPVAPVFWGFRVMVGTGMLMLVVSWVGWFIARRSGWGAKPIPRPLLWVLSGMSFSGWVATVAGWYVTEIGRQPFIVYGLVRTADVAATDVSSPMIAASLAMYLTVYIALIVAYVGVLKYMAEKPEDVLQPDTADQAGGRAAQALAGGPARCASTLSFPSSSWPCWACRC
jgi:cytochrome bd-type quinol oxidase subunit 1